MRHPFQRRNNPRNTIQTPFQKVLVGHFERFAHDKGVSLSGRQFSVLFGRSANHISQMLNDGFVPSGETILEMAEKMHLDREGTDQLIRAALETKAGKRSRDHFWINETLRMLKKADADRSDVLAFLKKQGIAEAFEKHLASRSPKNPRRPRR